MLFLSTRRKEL